MKGAKSIILLACLFVLFACAYGPSSISDAVTEGLQSNRVIHGMTHEMVVSVCGLPKRVKHQIDPPLEIWTYPPPPRYKSHTKNVEVIFIGGKVAAIYYDDWKWLDSLRTADYLYIQKSITRSSEETVRVWEKMVYTEKGLVEEIKHLQASGKKWKNLTKHI